MEQQLHFLFTFFFLSSDIISDLLIVFFNTFSLYPCCAQWAEKWKNGAMNLFLLFALFLKFSAQLCIGWCPTTLLINVPIRKKSN